MNVLANNIYERHTQSLLKSKNNQNKTLLLWMSKKDISVGQLKEYAKP